MPLYEITAPNGKRYRIEGPEGASREDVARAVLAQNPDAATPAPEPTISGYAREALKAVPRGFVGGLESAALGAASLLPGDTQEGFEKTAREGIKGFAERFKPTAAAGYEEAIPTKLGEALGSFGTLLLPGGVGGLAAKGLGYTARAGQLAAATPVAAALGAGEARERAVAAGATPEQITKATALGVIPGVAEMVPVDRLFSKMPDEIKGGIFEYVKRALVTGGFEGAQEAASAVAQNLIAQQVYKPSQELIEGVGENAAYGVGAGAIAQFLLDAVAGRRAPPKGEAERVKKLAEEKAAAEQQAIKDAYDALPGAVPPEKAAAAEAKIAAIKEDLKTLGKQKRGGSPEANALRQEIRALQKVRQLAGYGGTQTDLFGEVGGAYTPLSARPEGVSEQDKQEFLNNYRRAANDLNDITAKLAQAEEAGNQGAIAYFGKLEKQRKQALDAFEQQAAQYGVSEDEFGAATRGVSEQLQALRARQKTLNKKGQYDEATALQPRITTLEQQLAETTGTPLEREAGQRIERQADMFAEEMEAKPYPAIAPETTQPEVSPEVAAELERLEEQRAQLLQQKKTTSGERAKYIQNQIDAVDQNINALKQQGVPFEQGAGFAEQYLEQLTEAQEARLQQARGAFKQQIDQRRGEAEAEQAGERGELIAQTAPLEAILISRGLQLKEPKPRVLEGKTLTKELLAQPPKEKVFTSLGKDVTLPSLQESIDNGSLTAPVKELLGLRFRGSLSLAKGKDAEIALPVIQKRIYELERQRRTEFPSKELVEDGQLTSDGQQLVALEASLNILKRFESLAKMSLPQFGVGEKLSAAERTAVEKLEALPESRISPEEAEKRLRGLRKERSVVLDDFGMAIDGLRRGETTDPAEIEADKQNARSLLNNLIFFVTREAQLARVLNNQAPLTPEQIDQYVRPLRERLEKLVATAKPAATQREADLMRLLADAIQNKNKQAITKYRQQLAQERQRSASLAVPAKTIRLRNGVEVTKTVTKDGGSNTVVTREGKIAQNTTRYKYDAVVDGEKTVIRVEKNNITGETEAFTEVNGLATGSGLGIKQLIANGVSVEDAIKKVLPDVETIQKRQNFEGREEGPIIERGMTTGDMSKLPYPAQRIAQGESELGRLQTEIAKMIYKLGYQKKPKKQRVSEPFQLRGEMSTQRKIAAVENMLARAKAAQNPAEIKRAQQLLAQLRGPVVAEQADTSQKLEAALRGELADADRAALERAADLLAQNTVTKELVEEVNDATERIATGRSIDLTALQTEIRRTEDALAEPTRQREIEMPEERSFQRATPANLQRAAGIQRFKYAEKQKEEAARKKEEEEKAKAEKGRSTKEKLETAQQAFNDAKRDANEALNKERGFLNNALAKTRKIVDTYNALLKNKKRRVLTFAEFKKLAAVNPTLDRAQLNALISKYEKLSTEQIQFDKDVLLQRDYMQAVLKANKDYQYALNSLQAAEKYIAELKTRQQAEAVKRRVEKIGEQRAKTDNTLTAADKDAATQLREWADSMGAEITRVTTEQVPVKISAKELEKIPESERTELAQTQAAINNLTERIRAIATELGISGRVNKDADKVRNFTSAQRKLYNQRLGFIDQRAQLKERMVALRRVSTKVRKPEELTASERTRAAAEDIATRVLPRQYEQLDVQIKELKQQLEKVGPSKIAKKAITGQIKALTDERDYINKIAPIASTAAVEAGKKRKVEIRKKLHALRKNLVDINKRKPIEQKIEDLKQQQRAVVEQAKKYGIDLYARQTRQESQKEKQRDMSEAGLIKRNEVKTEQDVEAWARNNNYSVSEIDSLVKSYRDASGDADWRDANDTDRGVDAAEAAAVAERVKKALPEGVKFVYAPTFKDAPVAFVGAMLKSGRTSAKGAVMPDGTVVVVGEAHKSTADLEETIAHELIGHYGTDIVLGKDGVQALSDKLFARGDAHVAEVAVGLGLYPNVETARMALRQGQESKLMQVREMIARASEGRRVAPSFAEQVKTFIRDMISAVRSWMRNTGLSSQAKKDTKEIQALIRDAERALKDGRPGVYITPDGNAVFRDGDSSDLDWMSDTSKEVLRRVVATQKSAIDTVKGNVLGLTGVTQGLDRTAPFLAALQRGAATGKISDLEASQARYYLVAHDKRMNFTRNVAAEGPLELKKYAEGARNYWMVQTKEGANNPSLVKVFKELGESGMKADEAGRVFTLWLASQRVKNEGIGVEALNYGVDKDGEPVLTAAKLRGVEKDVASQPKIAAAFEKARETYNAYNAGLIDFAVQAGAISPELAAELKRKKDFIPFYREVGGNVQLFIGSEAAPITIGNLKDQPYLHELVGGTKPIQDVFTSSVQNTHMLTDMALRNITTKNVVYTLKKLGMLNDRGREGMVIRNGPGPASPLTIRFKENGIEKHAVVQTENTIFEDIPAELLVKGLEGVKTTFPAALQLLGFPARLLRKFVVLNPLYPVRQIMRDSLSAYGTSGADFNPLIDPTKNVVKALFKKSASARELETKGLLGGQVLAGEGLEGMSTILRGITSGRTTLSTGLAKLEAMSMYADVGTRVSAYDSYKRMGFNDIDAFLATNDIIDFNRRGLSPSVYFMNTLVPFFNTQLQSLNVTYRSARGRMPYEDRLNIQNKFWRRGLGMAVMTMIYAAMMEDDEAYKNATPEQRLSSWFVRVPGLDEPVRIPIPFEYGLLFKAIPEAFANTIFGQDEFKPIAKGLATLAWQSVPNITPQAAKPFIEFGTGKDLFTGADVETAQMKRLDPTERFRDDTTELAKLLSGASQGMVSPVQVDQFVRGVGTQLAVAMLSAANPVLRDPNAPSSPEMKMSKKPVIGSLFQANDGNRVIDYVYEELEKAEQARNTFNKLVDEGRDAEAERYMNRESARLSLSDSAPSFRREMQNIKKAEEAVKRDPTMSSEEKRKELDELRKMRLEIATDYRDIIRQSSE